MRIAVTGCCGFIGSHFAEMALAAGHDLIGVDAMMYSGRKKNMSEMPGWFAFYKCDINDAEMIGALLREHQPDAIVHFAAETHVARSIESREEFLRTNVLGTNVLLEESLKYWRGGRKPEDAAGDKPVRDGFRFLHVSTDEVYGSLGADEQAWTEDSPYLPNNPYAASKAASDHLVRSYHHTYGLPAIITHAANNYGTKQHPEKLIPTLIRQCMNGEPMTLHGDGQQKRDWLHVDDHCRGLLAALEHGKVGEVYNFGGDCELRNYDIAVKIGNRIRHMSNDTMSPGIVYIADRAGNDRRYLMSNTKVQTELDWFTRNGIEASLPEIIEWYFAHPNYGEEYGR